MTRFDSFVILAEMRTGSNLLEAALNLLPGVTCHGEAFNPALIGAPDRSGLLGLTRAERDADPLALWGRIRTAPGLNGCRYFHDHDPRVLPAMLEDPHCAKIILTRNPAESYISLKIARATGQWKLGDARHRKAARAEFDPAEFETHLETLQAFQIRLLHALQTSGQTAFYLDYEDAQDLDVLNGLARWLGAEGGLDTLPSSLVVQNPGALADKVTNFARMEATLAGLDRFNLSRTPNFEPRRGPGVPGYIAAAGLLYMPMRSPLDGVIRDWLATLGPVETDFTQRSLRQWKRRTPGHRSFTVLRHPLMRGHLAFAALMDRKGMAETRDILRKTYRLPLPETPAPEAWARGLEAFLIWLKANLNGQTALQIAPFWASQSALIDGFSRVSPPDVIARENTLPRDLHGFGHGAPAPCADPAPVKLADIASPALEKAAREAYARDYLQFGFGNWPDQAA